MGLISKFQAVFTNSYHYIMMGNNCIPILSYRKTIYFNINSSESFYFVPIQQGLSGLDELYSPDRYN